MYINYWSHCQDGSKPASLIIDLPWKKIVYKKNIFFSFYMPLKGGKLKNKFVACFDSSVLQFSVELDELLRKKPFVPGKYGLYELMLI